MKVVDILWKSAVNVSQQPCRTFASRVLVPRPTQVFIPKYLPTAFQIKDPLVVETVATHLSSDPQNEKSIILEASPGPGLLTRNLLKKGLPHLHVFHCKPLDNFCKHDPQKEFESVLKDFPDRVTVHHLTDDFEGPVPRILTYYSRMCDRLPSILNIANKFDNFASQWEADPQIKCFIPTPPGQDSRMFYQIIMDLIRTSGIYSYGRTELLAIISYHAYSMIIADPKKRNIPHSRMSLVLQTMFDVEELGTFPWSSFTPELVPRTRVRKLKETSYFDADRAFLVKLTPKKCIIEDIPVESWQEYYFYISQTLYKTTGYVIPFFERWFPGCGPKLIKAGVPIYSQFGSTTPEVFLTSFKTCISWPEYSTSGFKHVAQSLDPFKDEDPILDKEEEEHQEEESSFS